MAGDLTPKWAVTLFGTVHRFDWVSSGGALTGNPQTMPACVLRQATVLPTTGGATQPTDGFTVKLVTGDGLDLLGGRGAGSTNGAPTMFSFEPPVYLKAGSLDLRLVSAGNDKTGAFEFVLTER